MRALAGSGGGSGRVFWAPKWGHFSSEYPIVNTRSWDSLPALAETSPRALFEPYFSRACPQDDVSSARQTPSNYYHQYGLDLDLRS